VRLIPAARNAPSALRWGIAILAAVSAFALLAPLFGSPVHQDFAHGLSANGFPVGLSARYPLGTDTLGRSMLARLAYGARASLVVAVVSTVSTLTVALAVGLIAGFFRGKAETVLMRIIDVALAFPAVLVALILAALMPAGLLRVLVIITVLFWAYPARIVYSEVLRMRNRGFVEAAEAAGSPGRTTIRRHVLPHLVPLIASYAPLNAAAAILFEATLSYLGAGIDPPAASWGNMISDGQQSMGFAPHILVEPALFLAFTILGFLLVSEGLRAREHAVSRVSWLAV
jgi:ABC-type dipeptide/oligopeptide/nickel transport system permease subunit